MTERQLTVMASHARSLYEGDSAMEFARWLNKNLAKLSDNERAAATMEVRGVQSGIISRTLGRQQPRFYMVGIKWREER